MRRRRVLASLGAGFMGTVSGCRGFESGDGTTATEVDGMTAATQTKLPDSFQGLARMKLVSTDSVPVEYNLRFDAEVIEPVVTRDSTAKIRISVENTSEKHDSWYSVEGMLLFQDYVHDEEPPTVSLIDELNSDPTNRSGPTCWIPDEPIPYGDAPGANWIRAGDTESTVLHLWGHPDNPRDRCIPAGKYRFEDKYQAATADETRFTWGLAIDVEK